MQELRKDPIHGGWVIIASERRDRPTDYAPPSHPGTQASCAFCAGNEIHTPPEVLSYRRQGKADDPGWSVRVVPNKYPALESQGDVTAHEQGLFSWLPAVGAHEVVIETPQHDAQLPDLSAPAMQEVLQAYAARIQTLGADPRFQYVLVFKNSGPQAGATLEHSHSQIIATPVVPRQVQVELDGAARHHQSQGRCVFCDILDQEEGGPRWIAEENGVVALSPFAARFPYETWILPRRHAAHFEDMTPGQRPAVAAMVQEVLGRLRQRVDQPPYNLVVHTAPCNDHGAHEYYHWHLEIMPKLTQPAGFEWGSGFYINPMPPEEATRVLRPAVHPDSES